MTTPTRSFVDGIGLDGGITEWADLESRSLMVAWATCPRGEWLLQMAARLDVERKLVVRAAADCAAFVAPLLTAEPTGERALASAHGWLTETTLASECWAAATDAAHRADEIEVAEPATAHALRAVAALAFGCDGAADPAYWASRAYVVEVGHHVARAYGAESTRGHRDCADAVRQHLPFERISAAMRQAGRGERTSGFHAVDPATTAALEEAGRPFGRPSKATGT